jgi:hypothetical protein
MADFDGHQIIRVPQLITDSSQPIAICPLYRAPGVRKVMARRRSAGGPRVLPSVDTQATWNPEKVSVAVFPAVVA